MVLLDKEAQVEAQFSLFQDSANLDVSTKASRGSTLGYTHGSSLSADRCASYELDGDARHRQHFYLGSAAVWA